VKKITEAHNEAIIPAPVPASYLLVGEKVQREDHQLAR
jgi:hypothetical protein